MNRLVRYQAVQELPVVWPTGGSGSTMSLLNVNSVITPPPEIRLRFTDISLLADTTTKAYIFQSPAVNIITTLTIADCQLHGGYLNLAPNPNSVSGRKSLALTNKLLHPAHFT